MRNLRLAVLCLAACGGFGDGHGGATDGITTLDGSHAGCDLGNASAPNLFTFILNNIGYDWSSTATAGQAFPDHYSEIRGDQGGTAFGSLIVDVPDVPPLVGHLYDCTVPNVVLGLVAPLAGHDSWTAAYNVQNSTHQASSCLINFTSVGGDGQPVIGSFSGNLANAGQQQFFTIMDGKFNVIWNQQSGVSPSCSSSSSSNDMKPSDMMANSGGGGDMAQGDSVSNLTATPGNGQVTLNWSWNGFDILGFDIYYSTQSTVSPSNHTGSASTTQPPYTVTGLAHGTTYYFLVTIPGSQTMVVSATTS